MKICFESIADGFKNFFYTLKSCRRSILLYLVYYCMVGGIVFTMTYDGDKVFACPGFIMMLVGMFAFWITLFFLKFGDYFGDSTFLTRKEALWLGLVSTGLLLVLQLYIRHAYDHYGFFSMFALFPDYENLKTYQGHLITFKNILVGLLGFSFFSLQMEGGDNVGYDYVEVTTYFNDSGMEIDQKVSDRQRAVGGYIKLGLATTILPFCVSLTPLMILVFGYFWLHVKKQKSEKSVRRKRIALWTVTAVLSVASVVLMIAPLSLKERAVLKYKWSIDDGELYCTAVAVLNESTATYIEIPERHFFVEIDCLPGIFDDCDKIETAKIPYGMIRQFPTAKELIITHEGNIGNMENINPSIKMSAEKISFKYDIKRFGCSLSGFESLCELEFPNSLEYLGEYDFTRIKRGTTVYNSGAYVGSKDNPYLVLTAVDVDATSLVLHPDTRFITSYAVYNCNKLQTVDLTAARDLKSIGVSAFAGCRSLESITIPDTVSRIGSSAFAGCTALLSVTFPEKVTEVQSHLFGGCEKLSTVVLSARTYSIDRYAFQGCNALESIFVPSTLFWIHVEAWNSCNAKIYYHGNAEQWKAVVKKDLSFGESMRKPIYYSETEAQGCWHYGDNGEILEW